MFEGIITLNATTGELKEFNAFRLLFDSTAVLDTVLQCYNFAVLFIATPKAMVDYRYYLCMQIISDLIFEIWYGYILAPRVTPVSNCFITRGPLVLTTETSSRFAAGFLFFSVGLVICAQHYSYLYRLALFKFGHDFYTIQEKLNRPLVRIAGLVVMIAVAVVVAFAVSNITLSPQEVKKLLPNAKNVLLCTGVSSGNLAWFVIIFILLLTSQLINIIGGILIIKEIKSAAVLMKQENYKLNLQLSTVLLIQGAVPFVCVFLPIIVMALIVPAIFSDRDTYNEVFVQLMPKTALILISLFPVISALLTIFGIRPYRQFAKRLFGRIFCCIAMSKKSISPRAIPPMAYTKTIVPAL